MSRSLNVLFGSQQDGIVIDNGLSLAKTLLGQFIGNLMKIRVLMPVQKIVFIYSWIYPRLDLSELDLSELFFDTPGLDLSERVWIYPSFPASE